MLIAISGSQGSGKSTIVDELVKKGNLAIERKSARSILEEWNVTLQEVNDDAELTMKFQEEISKRKFQDEEAAILARSENLWFTERTHADLFAYALVSLGKDNRYTDWLNEYYSTCLHYSQLYDAVYYLKGGLFSIQHDGTRGSGIHYSRMVDLTMLDLTHQMIHNSRLTIIDTPDLEQRVELIGTQSDARIARAQLNIR